MRYMVFDPESKVIGQAMLGFRAATETAVIEPLLKKHGLSDIQADRWYPLQLWLDVLSEISELESDYASMLVFVNIGQKVANSVTLPPEMEEKIKKAGVINFLLEISAPFYFRDHQGKVGEYIVEKIDEKHLRFEMRTPYPPDFWYGIIHGGAKRFALSNFYVQYEDMAMRQGGPDMSAVIHLVVA